MVVSFKITSGWEDLECGKIKSLLLSKKGEGEFIGSRIAGAVRLN